jgi:hypothetical protein
MLVAPTVVTSGETWTRKHSKDDQASVLIEVWSLLDHDGVAMIPAHYQHILAHIGIYQNKPCVEQASSAVGTELCLVPSRPSVLTPCHDECHSYIQNMPIFLQFGCWSDIKSAIPCQEKLVYFKHGKP